MELHVTDETAGQAKRYSIIYADPPWSYRDKAVAGRRGVELKYGVMTLADIAPLPVQDLAADNCALFMWATFPQLPGCLDVLKRWGFKYKTAAFTRAKTNPTSGSYFIGMGSYTRSNAEVCPGFGDAWNGRAAGSFPRSRAPRSPLREARRGSRAHRRALRRHPAD